MKPAVSRGFERHDGPAGAVFISPRLKQLADHVFTTRQLRFRDESLAGDLTRLGAAFNLKAADIVSLNLVHGRSVFLV